MVSRNSFGALSLTLEDEEDNIKALMTFSSSQTTKAPSHVSTEPQLIRNKHQKHKTFHSKPKTYTTLAKKSPPNVGMRCGHSSMEKQLFPMANTNGMVFNSHLKKNYGRNHESLTVSYNLRISCSYHPMPHTLFTYMHHSPHSALKLSQHCSSHASTWKMHETRQFFCLSSKSMCHVIQKPTMHSHPKLFQHCPTAHIFGPCIHHAWSICCCLAISISLLLHFSIGSPLDTRQGCKSSMSLQPYFSGLLLFLLFFNSFLDRFSPIPQMPTKVHHHFQAWVHSMQATPASRPLSSHFGGPTHHGFHPKYPLKFCQDDNCMTCCPPQLPQPTPSFFTLLFKAQSCWMHTLHSSLGCCFKREKTGTSFSQILRPINLLSLCHPFQAKDPL